MKNYKYCYYLSYQILRIIMNTTGGGDKPMNIYELNVRTYLLKNIPTETSSNVISTLIDQSFLKDPKMMEMHKENAYKCYSFNSFYPLEKDKVYKEGKLYNLQIRTIDKKFVEHCKKYLINSYTESLKVLTISVKTLPKKHIERIYSITPLILKNDDGYWKKCLTFDQYVERVKVNLIKKYKYFYNVEINEDFELFTYVKLDNGKPVAFHYKGIKLLGDKVTIHVAENEMAQKLAYLALGVGAGEMSARGAGYMSYQAL